MRRREVIALITGTAAECLATRARAQPSKTFRLGILLNTRNAGVDELLKGLRDHGYVEGENLIIEFRFSEGVGERWPELASELAVLKVDAIVVQTTPAALAAKQATSTIPIVITTAIDPVGAGSAESSAQARPARRGTLSTTSGSARNGSRALAGPLLTNLLGSRVSLQS